MTSAWPMPGAPRTREMGEQRKQLLTSPTVFRRRRSRWLHVWQGFSSGSAFHPIFHLNGAHGWGRRNTMAGRKCSGNAGTEQLPGAATPHTRSRHLLRVHRAATRRKALDLPWARGPTSQGQGRKGLSCCTGAWEVVAEGHTCPGSGIHCEATDRPSL